MDDIQREIARMGIKLTENQISILIKAKETRSSAVKDALDKYNTIKKQAERIAYLEQRVQEQREEIQRMRNGV